MAEAERFVGATARVAGDEEWRQRARQGTATAQKLAADQPVTGATALGRLLGGVDGPRMVAQARVARAGGRYATSGAGEPS